MTSKDMGTFIIFDMQQYEDDWQKARSNSNAFKLAGSMEKLGFVVHTYKNPTTDDIVQALKKHTAGQTDVNAFGCAICTHGWSDGWLSTYKEQEWINVAEIKYYLHQDKAKALFGKPKVLLIQGMPGTNIIIKQSLTSKFKHR